MGLRQTRFSDVCGTVDELKRRLGRRGDLARQVEPLLADAEFMIRRMRARCQEYDGFRDEVRQIARSLDDVGEVDARPAEQALARTRRCLAGGKGLAEADVQALGAAAEEIRTVANGLENRMRQFKHLALKLHGAYEAARGGRPWLTPGQVDESTADRMRRAHQAWLPPEPHRGKLLDYLAAARAHVADERLPDGQPVVQFEDGGAMPMSQVRWNEILENFCPASFRPGNAQG